MTSRSGEAVAAVWVGGPGVAVSLSCDRKWDTLLRWPRCGPKMNYADSKGQPSWAWRCAFKSISQTCAAEGSILEQQARPQTAFLHFSTCVSHVVAYHALFRPGSALSICATCHFSVPTLPQNQSFEAFGFGANFTV